MSAATKGQMLDGSGVQNLVGMSDAQLAKLKDVYLITTLQDLALLDKADVDSILGTNTDTFVMRRKLMMVAEFIRKGGSLTSETTIQTIMTWGGTGRNPTNSASGHEDIPKERTPGKYAVKDQSGRATTIHKEDKIPVRNFFLLKHIADDGDDKLNLVGTMVQNVFDTNKYLLDEDVCDEDDCPKAFHFDYRFNDLMADEGSGFVKTRRVEKNETSTRTTFQISAPLDVDVIFDVFPFKAVTATLVVELSTTAEDKKRLRPNLLIAQKDKRNNVSVQRPYWARSKNFFSQVLWEHFNLDDDEENNEKAQEDLGGNKETEPKDQRGNNEKAQEDQGGNNEKAQEDQGEIKGKEQEDKGEIKERGLVSEIEKIISDKKKIEALKDKMDRTKNYDFITPFPKVEYLYNTKKDYCPKCQLTFYLIENGDSKLVAILAPMLLISILNTLNVFNNEEGGIDNVDYIANSATFALTAVFILPNIFSKANRTDLLTTNTAYVFLIFVGLSLSSFPEELVGTRGYAIAGVALLWSSFFIPLFACASFYVFTKTIRTGEINDFINDKDFKQFNYEVDNYKDKFYSVGEIADKEGVNTLYKSKERDKITHVTYRTKKCNINSFFGKVYQWVTKKDK
uniref:Uncharacterized protein n=1 Tax=Ditylum brightwellii TaxID=49249 RepID=A0A7S4T6R9_9STRA